MLKLCYAEYSDYTPINSTMTFFNAMSSLCFQVNIINDKMVEEDIEIFNLSLKAIEPEVTTILTPMTTISIHERNNDGINFIQL